MSSVLISFASHDAGPAHRKRRSAARLAALLAVASTLAVPWDARPVASGGVAAVPLVHGDVPVAKGAHGRRLDGPGVRLFGDPAVRKGAGGR